MFPTIKAKKIGIEFDCLKTIVYLRVMLFRNFDRLIVLDFETNGGWSPLNQPIQVCMKIVDKGEKPVIFKSYIKCPTRLNSLIVQLTGITDEILAEQGRDIKEVFLDVAKILFEKENTCLIGFYIRKFDKKFLDYYLMKCWDPMWPANCKMQWSDEKVFDTAGRFKAELMGMRQKVDETRLEFEIRAAHCKCHFPHTLADALNYYGIKTNGKFHTADQDVDKTDKLFIQQAKKMAAEEKAIKDLSAKRKQVRSFKPPVVKRRPAAKAA
jgi:DNA polymerase III alpha subunit (gram-positive type)